MTGLGKMFPAFDIEGRVINIQYPIEFTHISHLNSMVWGLVCVLCNRFLLLDFSYLFEFKPRLLAKKPKSNGA